MKAQNILIEEVDAQNAKKNSTSFHEHHVLHELKHYLPAQAPLKDFIHHNTLHAFQNLKFEEALTSASQIFGYKVSLTLREYRDKYKSGQIRKDILEKIITERKGADHVSDWVDKLLKGKYTALPGPRIGMLRSNWKRHYKIDLDSLVQPLLFRILCSYLDQGISIWNFPIREKTFLASLQEIERNSLSSFFKTKRARTLLLQNECTIESLLDILIGDKGLYAQYLYDQQFAHQGWSGMVSTIEDQPQTLLDARQISIHDLVVFETLLEIDAMDNQFGANWEPLAKKIKELPIQLFAPIIKEELHDVLVLWQNAFEWSYYDEVLAGLSQHKIKKTAAPKVKSFQAMFCIDDRECSLRRYLEKTDHSCETFGTPGFFSVEFFFQPEDGKFYTKLCPQPVTPKYLIKETGSKAKREKDAHFSKHTHSFHSGWLITQTLGFWSALKLFINIFKPSMSPATASSFKHMDRFSKLTIENKDLNDQENNLQIGFTIDEMVTRVESLLKSIGLIKDFAPLVYIIGHGSSSVNNPHYAAYDCGACSGRAGSVNSRVVCHMANHPEVRAKLSAKGIVIPNETQFIGGLHDTTRDEIMFFDEHNLSVINKEQHLKNEIVFKRALDLNAKERSRRFELVDSKKDAHKIHEEVLLRSVSLFEPRPELNHATNALCIVGKREMTKDLFLDRRSFLNSYDYSIDLDGKLLYGIMRPLGPVCGGINLEYFFSRVDNQKLGAGTKLPHNVMGLFGVANGIDGDLRPGLPSQMIEVHDPVRLLLIVEHFPEIVLTTIQKAPEVYEWFINEWVILASQNPVTREISVFKEGAFHVYHPLKKKIETVSDVTPLIESSQDNLSVYTLSQD
jgi:uncharacterized protein YbcC (UPF0753/DUF2309 family)